MLKKQSTFNVKKNFNFSREIVLIHLVRARKGNIKKNKNRKEIGKNIDMNIATFSMRLAGRQARTEQNGTKQISVVEYSIRYYQMA